MLLHTGVMLATERDVTVESAFTSRPKLSDVVLTLSTVIEFRRSLLLASLRVSPPLTRLPPPDKVRVFAPTLIADSRIGERLTVSATSIVYIA